MDIIPDFTICAKYCDYYRHIKFCREGQHAAVWYPCTSDEKPTVPEHCKYLLEHTLAQRDELSKNNMRKQQNLTI